MLGIPRRSILLGMITGAVAWSLAPAESKWHQQWQPETTEKTPHMAVYRNVTPPPVFLSFCARFRHQCEEADTDPQWVATPERLMQLAEVNHAVNQSMEAMADQDLYEVSDYWTIPIVPYGDCEDYALVKRQQLIELGWPASALLITVVLHDGEGHAVLTVVTPDADLVLDNKTNELRPWHETPYEFVSRQSSEYPREWHSLLRWADHWGGY